MSCVDLRASAITEIPDIFRKSVEQHNTHNSYRSYIQLQLTRDRLRSFVRSFVRFRSFDFVCSISFVTTITAMYYCRNLNAIGGLFILSSINR